MYALHSGKWSAVMQRGFKKRKLSMTLFAIWNQFNTSSSTRHPFVLKKEVSA